MSDENSWPCGGCGIATRPSEVYMLADEVWNPVADGARFLCVGCLEERLDRRLDADDFVRVPLNDDSEFDSVRLRVRKGSGRCTEPLYRWAVVAVVDLGRDQGEVAAALGLEPLLLAIHVDQTSPGVSDAG
jgi:hypothetical protein